MSETERGRPIIVIVQPFLSFAEYGVLVPVGTFDRDHSQGDFFL